MQLGSISESNHSATNSKTNVTTAESISLFCRVLDLPSSWVTSYLKADCASPKWLLTV